MNQRTTSNDDIITIVSGLPRSGTSMRMQMLVAGGIPPLVDHVWQADEDNAQGYDEFERVKQIGIDSSWGDVHSSLSDRGSAESHLSGDKEQQIKHKLRGWGYL